jgi:hypothetical protein
MLKSKIFFFKEKFLLKENEASFWNIKNILFVKMKSSKLTNYLVDTCETCSSTTISICIKIIFFELY